MTPAHRIELPSFHGDAVFLSASVPAPDRDVRYRQRGIRRVPHAALEIEEAVVSLARAVFSAGGRLVFGGHPSITPLVAMVAAEYAHPRAAERESTPRQAAETPLVTVYQLDVYHDLSSEATQIMTALGHAKVIEVPSEVNERGNDATLGSLAFPNSLAVMRTQMISESRPRAMVCIGGMEGVESEAEIFFETMRTRPIYALETTGGAAALLGEREDRRVRFIDREVLGRLGVKAPAEVAEAVSDGLRAPMDELLIPYPLIMQVLVAELLDDRTAQGPSDPRAT